MTLLVMLTGWLLVGLDFVTFEHRWNSDKQSYLHFSKPGLTACVHLIRSHHDQSITRSSAEAGAGADICQALWQIRHGNVLYTPDNSSAARILSVRRYFKQPRPGKSQSDIFNFAPKNSPPVHTA